MESPTPLADRLPPPGARARMRLPGWVVAGIVWLVGVGVLAVVIGGAAAEYYLEIPMRTPAPQTTRLFYWHEGDDNGYCAAIVDLTPGSLPTHVRFPLGRQKVTALIVDPTLAEGETFIGVPVLRNSADRWLRFNVSYHTFALTDYNALHQITSIEQEGDFLHVVTTPKADISICSIALPQPLLLGWSAGAFARNFLPLALAWVGLVVLGHFALRKFAVRWIPPDGLWSGLVRTLLAPGEASGLAIPRWEKWAVLGILAVSALVQVNAVLHGGSKGQDYPGLYRYSENIFLHPEKPWYFGPQDPPVFVLTNALLIWLARGVRGQEVCGMFNLAVNVFALWLFYRLSRRFITGAAWRVALLTLVAFLPVRLIHAVVLSGDALTLWPFFALAWVMVVLTDEKTTRNRRRVLAGVGALLLTLGVLTKYTFMSAFLAVLLSLVQLARRGTVPWRETACLLALALVMPIGVEIGQQRAHPSFSKALQLRWNVAPDMSWRDILWPHARDAHIFRAPPYDEPLEVERRVSNGKPYDPGGQYELLVVHQYSYLALTHLATFTDSLNIFQYDPTDAYFGQRNSLNQRLMALAVKTALPVTLLCVGVMLLLSVPAIVTGLLRPGALRPDLEAVYLLGFGWFSNIVVFLPYVKDAYWAGYWTPRLTMPGILVFLLFTVYALERFLPAGRVRTVAAWLVLGYVVAQSALQVAFLWPWGKIY